MNMKRNQLGRRAATAALAALTLLIGTTAGAPRAARAEEGAEPAKRTKMLPALAALPARAVRITDAETRKEMEANLSTLVKEAGLKIVASETLLWNGAAGAAARKKMDGLAAALKAAGYPYSVIGTEDTEDGKVTVFSAIHAGKRDPLFGMWLQGKDYLLLSWGRSTMPPAPKKAAEAAPAPTPAAAATSETP